MNELIKIENGIKDIYIIKVPDETYACDVDKNGFIYFVNNGKIIETTIEIGDLTLLGLRNDISEHTIKGLVFKDDNGFYFDYMTDKFHCKYSRTSFTSLIEKNTGERNGNYIILVKDEYSTAKLLIDKIEIYRNQGILEVLNSIDLESGDIKEQIIKLKTEYGK